VGRCVQRSQPLCSSSILHIHGNDAGQHKRCARMRLNTKGDHHSLRCRQGGELGEDAFTTHRMRPPVTSHKIHGADGCARAHKAKKTTKGLLATSTAPRHKPQAC
jgi:hypothetical protein